MNPTNSNSDTLQTKLLWAAVAALGAISFAIVALNRGEAVNAAWLVVAAVCIYFIAYRFYGLWVARRALGVDEARSTPAWRHNDGLDYVPTNRYVLYGHHFAAIAGAGPLVGPVLAAQMGYLPGTLWILAGVVFAGAVQDMIALFLSTRRDGRSLGDMIRSEMGPVAGTIAGIGVLLICVIILAVLAPRDYLSTFLKVGTVALLAVGVLIARPELQMAAITKFVDGTGPVWSGSLFPFLFITVACGAVSGWHSLISSGTTPKMIESETQIAFIGYGGMLMESFVAIMAMIAASVIHPGACFAMNTGAGDIGATGGPAADVVSSWGFTVTPDMLNQVAHDVGELSVLSRTGGAPTLAVGMATIFSSFLGGRTLMAFWYHFVILFEALFILTTVDAGTRVCRFMIQDLVGHAIPAFKETRAWGNNLIGSAVSCVLWGYLLYAGVIDPYGGCWTLWPLFGATHQMLAAIALSLCTVVLFKMKRERYAWVTIVPTAWLVVCTVTAGLEKVLSR